MPRKPVVKGAVAEKQLASEFKSQGVIVHRNATAQPSTKGLTQVPITTATKLVTIDDAALKYGIVTLQEWSRGAIVRIALGPSISDEKAAELEGIIRGVAKAVKVLPRTKASVTIERTHQQTVAPKTQRAVVLELLEDGAHGKDDALLEYVNGVMDKEKFQ